MSNRERNFDRLFRQHYRLVYLYFIKLGAQPEEASDLAQEVFFNAYGALDEFRGDSSERTWLFSIAKNKWRNWLRDRSRHKRSAPETPIEELLDEGWQPSEPLEKADPLQGTIVSERQQKILDAINSLPPRMRRCLMLRVAQDKKYREIADVMQISIQTVRSQLAQGRDHLKSLLNDYSEDFL